VDLSRYTRLRWADSWAGEEAVILESRTPRNALHSALSSWGSPIASEWAQLAVYLPSGGVQVLLPYDPVPSGLPRGQRERVMRVLPPGWTLVPDGRLHSGRRRRRGPVRRSWREAAFQFAAMGGPGSPYTVRLADMGTLFPDGSFLAYGNSPMTQDRAASYSRDLFDISRDMQGVRAPEGEVV
jgi:hypothetical protein